MYPKLNKFPYLVTLGTRKNVAFACAHTPLSLPQLLARKGIRLHYR